MRLDNRGATGKNRREKIERINGWRLRARHEVGEASPMEQATEKKQGTAWSRLSLRERAFVLAFMVDFNATNAARAVGVLWGTGKGGGKAAGNRGHRLVNRREIQRAVEEKLSERGIARESLIARFAEMALGADMRDYAPVIEDGKSIEDLVKKGVNTRLIKTYTRKDTKYGEDRSIELYSALDAGKTLGRLLGYIVNKMELRPSGAWLDEIRGMDPQEIERAARVAGIEGETRALPAIVAPGDVACLEVQEAMDRDQPPIEPKAPESVPKQTGTDPQKGEKLCPPGPETAR